MILRMKPASEAKQRSVNELEQSSNLSERIDTFTSDEKATPENVQELAQECFQAQLDLDESEIQTLALQINNAIVGVANVDQILADTADDLSTAQALKAKAEKVRDEAIAQREIANNVTKSLGEALVSQSAAENAVLETRTDIDSARSDLGQVYLNFQSY